MSTLTFTEKEKLERLLGMSGGYVLGFSDNTIYNFMMEVANINIHSEKYQENGTSKAKKMREFWRIESDYLVGKSIKALIQRIKENSEQINDPFIVDCNAIAERLLSTNVNLDFLKEFAVNFNAKHLDEQIRRIEQSITSDPSLAIGTSKELIEACCKTILAERGKPVSGKINIPQLTKEVLKELNLIPESISDAAKGADAIKRILQNLGSIGSHLAELRGLYGTGHGKHWKENGLSTRHAKLAVGAASTLVTFLFETHQETMPESLVEYKEE